METRHHTIAAIGLLALVAGLLIALAPAPGATLACAIGAMRRTASPPSAAASSTS